MGLNAKAQIIIFHLSFLYQKVQMPYLCRLVVLVVNDYGGQQKLVNDYFTTIMS